MDGKESPWGWMTVGVLIGAVGIAVLLIGNGTPALVAATALCVAGGVLTFVSGVAAGVAAGMARHEHLERSRQG